MPDLFEKISLLKKSNVFSQINTDDLRYVADVLDEEQFLKGDCIFKKGDRGDYMYVIIEGGIGITLGKGEEGCKFMSVLRSGDCLGEMNLLDDMPRSATAIVVENAAVLKLGRAKLRGLLMSYPELGLGMLKALSLKLRKATDLIEKNEKGEG